MAARHDRDCRLRAAIRVEQANEVLRIEFLVIGSVARKEEPCLCSVRCEVKQAGISRPNFEGGKRGVDVLHGREAKAPCERRRRRKDPHVRPTSLKTNCVISSSPSQTSIPVGRSPLSRNRENGPSASLMARYPIEAALKR